jgi:hypothetical protein
MVNLLQVVSNIYRKLCLAELTPACTQDVRACAYIEFFLRNVRWRSRPPRSMLVGLGGKIGGKSDSQNRARFGRVGETSRDFVLRGRDKIP